MKKTGFKYDVTLSFAEEDRDFVHSVAKLLKAKGIRYFYDDDKRIETWGKELLDHLDEVYRKDAKYCVMFISEHYKMKRWTNLEKNWALSRAFFSKNREYILPFRFDDTEIDGIRNSIAYLTHEAYDEERLAKAIADKVERNRSAASRIRRKTVHFFSRKLHTAATLLVIGGIAVLGNKDHLTPVDKLTKKLFERYKKVVPGSMCRDSSFSFHQGPGSCSYHNGVAYKKDSIIQTKTMEQCLKEAKQTSWLTE